VKSPGFFKPRGTHKGTKQPFFFFNLFIYLFLKFPNENIHGEANFYVFSVFILCLFSLWYFCLFKKRSKYIRTDGDFLFFIFYFVSSFLLI
jgi:O-antigen ligase